MLNYRFLISLQNVLFDLLISLFCYLIFAVGIMGGWIDLGLRAVSASLENLE